MYGCGFAASDHCLVSQLVYVDVPICALRFPDVFSIKHPFVVDDFPLETSTWGVA